MPYARGVVTKASLHIAVVDDEAPIRKALMRLMRSVGLSVETFASGLEFLKSLDRRLPDCVVLDLHMPHTNGFSVQAHLAQKHAALPVIIFTGHDLPNARERARAGVWPQALAALVAEATAASRSATLPSSSLPCTAPVAGL